MLGSMPQVALRSRVSGVPSTGQKLNLSAKSSWHLEQNFIFTTSLSVLGSGSVCAQDAGLIHLPQIAGRNPLIK